MRNRLAAILAGAVVLAAGTWLIAQGGGEPGAGVAQTVALGDPQATWHEPFSVVSTVRELPDGRVVVADPLGQVVVRLDFDAGAADTVGAVGAGPAEYRQPDAVWPLPNGETLLVDLGNGRLTVLSPELEFGATRPYSLGDISVGQVVLAIPQAVDERGRLYFRSLGMGMGGMPPDSGQILRYDMTSEALDTVASFGLQAVVRETSGGLNNQNERISQVPLSPGDAWGVAPDGRVAIARSADYHVDWVSGEGTVEGGPAVPYDAISIGRAEREAWADERQETGGGLSISIMMGNGQASMVASRGGSSDDDEDLDGLAWPEVMPAFYTRPIPVDDLGRAWVRRHVEGGEAAKYDVFDGSGERQFTVRLPVNRRVVGFGAGVLYGVHMDEYGLQTLERYALP